MSRFLPVSLVVAFDLLLMSTSLSAQAPPVPAQESLDYLGRGPVHEGYAQPQDLQPIPGPVAPKEPPPPLTETPPTERPSGDDVHWIPGYWQWDDERKDYIWITGSWRTPPPGRKWAPGAYVRTEAGWQRTPGLWIAANVVQTQYYPAPPAPRDEAPPLAPNAASIWVPGCWIYRDLAFRWRPGYYVTYQPGWVWVPASWRWTPAGYVFVDGYWDQPLGRRGWLYAPCAFASGFRFVVGYRFVPRYVVPVSFLTSALFVRGGWGHYYYGDYYRVRGFTPFVDYRVGRYAADPLFGYYRHAYKPERLREVQGLYAARVAGRAPLPPRTLAQQQAILRSAAATEARRLTPLARPGQFSTRPVYRVPAQEQAHWQEHVRQASQLAPQRREIEHQLRSAGTTPLRAGDAPRTAHLPVVPSLSRGAVVRQPPARPRAPAPTNHQAGRR
jgi:hypothetical protein